MNELECQTATRVTVDADDLKFLLDHPAIAMHNPCNHFWVGCGGTKDVASRLAAALVAAPGPMDQERVGRRA